MVVRFLKIQVLGLPALSLGLVNLYFRTTKVQLFPKSFSALAACTSANFQFTSYYWGGGGGNVSLTLGSAVNNGWTIRVTFSAPVKGFQVSFGF